MLWMNTLRGYGLVSRVNHWLTALVFIALIPLGMVLEDMQGDRSQLFFQLMTLHKGLAVLLIGLVAMRLLWLFADRTRVPPEPVAQWQHWMSKSVRAMLWVGLVGMPLSGWLMSNSAGFPVGFFGLFDLPRLVSADETLHALAESVHGLLPKLLIFALLLHTAGALKHHFIDRDRTLIRMTRNVRSLI